MLLTIQYQNLKKLNFFLGKNSIFIKIVLIIWNAGVKLTITKLSTKLVVTNYLNFFFIFYFLYFF